MIHIFLGTKAQLIKMSPIMRELQTRKIEYNFIFSGQHQATIDNIRAEFGVKTPDQVLYNGADVTGIFQMLGWVFKVAYNIFRNRDRVWAGDRCGVVLNHGDTFSTLLGTIAAKLCGHKAAHVESGLRSFNVFQPFPEELTRRLTFLLSDIYFCPGEWAVKNVRAFKGVKVNTINNTLMDALNIASGHISKASVDIPNFEYAVVSIHRFENIFRKSAFEKLIVLLEYVAEKTPILFILHKPTLKKLIQYSLYDRLAGNPRVELRPRYTYFEFIKLVKSARFVVTDGGSNQEECYYLGKPCLLMRSATERQEGLSKNVRISKFELSIVKEFLDNIEKYNLGAEAPGEQSPSIIIVDGIKDLLRKASTD